MTPIRFYFDEMMNRSAAETLNKPGYQTVLANDVDMTQKSDFEHLAYARQHGTIVVTQDRKFAGLASKRMSTLDSYV